MSETPVFDGIGSSLSGMPMPKRDNGSAMGTAIDQQSAEIENLIDEVHRLLDKIQPITGPDMHPSTGASDKPATPALPNSDLVNVINQHSRKLNNLRQQVVAVRERVEL
jgi:hypothetical protein